MGSDTGLGPLSTAFHSLVAKYNAFEHKTVDQQTIK